MAQVSALVQTLKASLKAAGLKYTQVAALLQLSESSIKRKFSRKDFSLEELDAICGLAGLQISDLVKAMEEKQGRLQSLGAEQEQEIASDLGLLLVTVCVLNRWSFDDILDFYVFTEPELVKLLAALDRLQVIELLPGNRIKLLVAPNFGWRPNGPIEHVFLDVIQRDFFATRFDRANHKLVVLNGMLSVGSSAEFQRRMERLAREFDQLNQEDASLAMDEKHGATVLLALRDWNYQGFEPYRKTPRIRQGAGIGRRDA